MTDNHQRLLGAILAQCARMSYVLKYYISAHCFYPLGLAETRVMDDVTDVGLSLCIGILVAAFLLATNRVPKALQILKECLKLLNNKIFRSEKDFVRSTTMVVYVQMFKGYRLISDHKNAIECGEKLLVLLRESGDRESEGNAAYELAKLYDHQRKYKEAEELFKKSLNIMIETGNKQGEGSCYGNLGSVSWSLGENAKARGYLEKSLAFRKENVNGDKEGEAADYSNLGNVFQSIGEYRKAKEYHDKALAMMKLTGNRKKEASCYGNMGIALHSLGEYTKGIEYLEKALRIRKETGDKKGEASDYSNLGRMFQSSREFNKAVKCYEKALPLTKDIGDRKNEASCYGNLAALFQSVGDYIKANDYHEKAIAIRREIGDRKGEAESFRTLGSACETCAEYVKATEYFENALAIEREMGNNSGEATCYGNLGAVSHSVGEYAQAKDYFEKALAIVVEVGDKDKEASCYGNLGMVFCSLDEHAKAKEYLEKAIAIRKQIGDIEGEIADYGNLGNVFESLGEFTKSREYHEKALATAKKVGDKKKEASCYANLGNVMQCSGEITKAKEYLEKAIVLSKENGDVETELASHTNLSYGELLVGNVSGAKSHLFASIKNSEDIQNFLKDNDKLKISFFEKHCDSYQLLSACYLITGNPNEALSVAELGRARALADLMSAQYSVEKQTSIDPQSWVGIERIAKNENNCICLYISYTFSAEDLFLWILKADEQTAFRHVDVDDCFYQHGTIRNEDEIFGDQMLSKFLLLSHGHCEDRSWFSSSVSQQTRESPENCEARVRKPTEKKEQDPDETLALYYKVIIAPVADLLDKEEIIIVPDRSLFKVPFAALKNDSGKYLSESYRIRIVPSLTTLKLIQDTPADYHSQTGALIVGDPDVGEVLFKGDVCNPPRLPSAEEEAKMIGRLLGTKPLLGEQATKQAVLHAISSVSLIHFAAHGNAERGEIALAPVRPNDEIPEEEDYLLTMADIAQVRLRAKLVVLSCCHSARGDIKAEGAVGIARAFLGSGARSVLVALWAIDDEATMQFMSRFYEQLVRGESASESLHQAMKWMRENGFSEVEQWAPFMLIGDNVKMDFH